MCAFETATTQPLVVLLHPARMRREHVVPVGAGGAIELAQLIHGPQQWQGGASIFQRATVRFGGDRLERVAIVVGGHIATQQVVGMVVDQRVSLDEMAERVKRIHGGTSEKRERRRLYFILPLGSWKSWSVCPTRPNKP